MSLISIVTNANTTKTIVDHKASEGSDGAGRGSLFKKSGYRKLRVAPVKGAIRVQTKLLMNADKSGPLLSVEKKNQAGEVVVQGGQEQWVTEATVGFKVAQKEDPDFGSVTYLKLRLDGEEYVRNGEAEGWQPKILRLFDLIEATEGVTPGDSTHLGFKTFVMKLLEQAVPAFEKAKGNADATAKVWTLIDNKIADKLRSVLQPGQDPDKYPLVNACVSARAYFKEKVSAEALRGPDAALLKLVEATSQVVFTPSHAAYAKKTTPGTSPLSDQPLLPDIAEKFIAAQRKEADRRAKLNGGLQGAATSGTSSAPTTTETGTTPAIGDDALFE